MTSSGNGVGADEKLAAQRHRSSGGGSLFVVVAPSGAGKTSLVNELLRRDGRIRLSVSHTTRAPREGEAQGREYHFIDTNAFERMIASGDFLEHANRHGNYSGTSKRCIDAALAGDHDVL